MSVKLAVPMCVKAIVEVGGAPTPVKVRTKLLSLSVKSALSESVGQGVRGLRRLPPVNLRLSIR